MKFRPLYKLPGALIWAIVLGILGYFPVGNVPAQTQPNQVLDWNEVLMVFDRYFNYPSPENAKAVLGVLPREIPDKVAGNKGEALEYIINSKEFRILASEARAGERYSAEILFRLRKFCDGWGAEVVDGTLGALLRINPMLFLEILFEYKDDPFTKRVGYPVAFPNYAYNNHASAFIYELGKRIEVLARVDDPKYDELKQACLEQIRKEMNRWLVWSDRPAEGPQAHKPSSPDLDWSGVLPVFEQYFNYPAPENAKAVLSVLPKERPGKVLGDTSRALGYINSAETYGILALESEAGDRYSAEILFRLLAITDVPETKYIKSTLGSIVRLNPRLFLEVLYEYKGTSSMKTAGYPVAYLGDAYLNRPCASRHELEKRIEALERVDDQKYIELKQTCLSELEQAIEKLKR